MAIIELNSDSLPRPAFLSFSIISFILAIIIALLYLRRKQNLLLVYVATASILLYIPILVGLGSIQFRKGMWDWCWFQATWIAYASISINLTLVCFAYNLWNMIVRGKNDSEKRFRWVYCSICFVFPLFASIIPIAILEKQPDSIDVGAFYW